MALTDKLTAIADAIRTKTGKTDGLTLEQMPAEITGISGGAGVEECDVTVTLRNYFSTMDGGVCYTYVGSDGKITSNDGPVIGISPGVNQDTFRCVKGSVLIAHKGNMPASTYTATTTGAITSLFGNSTADHTCMVFRVDGGGTITIE